MKVIFLDFDGVLNSEGSFYYEYRRRNGFKEQNVKGPINETLCNVCASNFQYVLDTYPDAKIVISSTWRALFPLEWLKEKLNSYHIKGNRVIDKTPDLFASMLNSNRGIEINQWLSEHPEVKHYIVIDDNDEGISTLHGWDKFVKTEWESGMTWQHAQEAIHKFATPKKKKEKKV
jgi:hypothetical protein